ncbi:hypothetical protein HRR83_004244 [Exophiala dermatitidis]|uniref:Transcription factor Iwr1 domain-containing protein n=2 Tax=Exophiala dermatitidis TaxID=5970 RepID=H6BQZ8_EXODN|nr:uncharacterized protein HMPREF1120_02800 [Exophiala dermatitidis NIH/UT8656]KAJ4511717.1 hypothetical protein HRR73_006293 [Exophiala dermatitidis]EHY54633.1 hypothetical protein HMPREF1120_02800 [Exophiala dermatitidis NIH/UT8656]KAJ4517785.1 hypothetical protein HRR75_003004 [Exophiala dermatitidis]KAJ4521450.1 hypothetical protein HRR74_003274 [Exophiala dermatitidis]KAJ4542124.1 hypothetical protein HRR77_006009 [Exophiala dermatitidis]
MSLAPERISVKRRRSDEPVDTLYLEHGTAPDKKRRVTDFYFQRLRDEIIAPISQREKSPAMRQPTQLSIPGVPPVRWTSPGDDKKDYERLKAKLKEKADDGAKTQESLSAPTTGSLSAPPTPAPASREGPHLTRRFHLTRNLSSALSPSASGGIRKQKSSIRPPLATFVERYGASVSHEENPLYSGKPVDKLLDVRADEAAGDNEGEKETPDAEGLEKSSRTLMNTFLQPSNRGVKKGTSIRDHPSTWDHESDQLADELAALAMELDPDIKQKAEAEHSSQPAPAPQDTKMTSQCREDDYVYETYVRVRQDDKTPDATRMVEPNNVGILVIEDEDEEFWQKYVDSDDDTDWDSEDSNAEDNPANDYPEDEVSSDDEYGYNAYKYRQYGSDDEAFRSDDDAFHENNNKW